MIATVVLRAEKPACSGCGARGLGVKEHRTKRWPALDLRACRRGRVPAQTAVLPGLRRRARGGTESARTGAKHTREFDDLAAWLAQQMCQTHVAKLLRIGWKSVGSIVERDVAHKLDRGRLDGLVGSIATMSHTARAQFLTCVADHQQGRIVWAAPTRNAKTLQTFFDRLTDEQRSSIKAVSIDMAAGHEKALRESVPDAWVCFDPFQVVQLGSRAIDHVRGAERKARPLWQRQGKWIKASATRC